jgi:short-subunit dehydrogenase
MFRYQGQTALVTGASSGIGAAFARELAARGMTTILVSRSGEALDALAAELREQHGAAVHVLAHDLRQPDASAQIAEELGRRELQVDLLINNAGVMTHGPFETIDPARDQDEIMVNIAAMVGLSHALLPGMLARREGGIINVASVAGFQPIPYLAVYAATKAFVISFSVALREECRDRNVHVMGLCPGTTATQLFDRAAAPEAALGKPRSPEQVVATALAGLDKRRSLIVDGLKNSLLSHGPRLIPRWFAARFAGQAVRPRRPRAGSSVS